MKILETEKTPLDIFCEASEILNTAVEHTLGPKGTNTAVVNKQGQYEIINDGKSIIENITSLDPAIAPALETLKQASFETNRKAGDGTTSTMVITNALLHGARDYLKETNITPVELRNKLEEVKKALLNMLDIEKRYIKEEQYEDVATVALGSSKYSGIVSDIFKFLGSGRRPTLMKSDIDNLEVEKIDGLNLTKSKIVSSLFVETSEHRDVKTICLFSPVNRFQEITQLLRLLQKASMGNDVILFYNQLSTDILENILFNYTSGALKVIPICLGGYGRNTYKIMKDVSEYCNCSLIDNTELKVSEVSKMTIGNIEYAIINSEQVIIKTDKEDFTSEDLDNKSVMIRIGGTNVIEREETYRRIEDAVNSLGNAIEYGIVTGGGKTYYDLIGRVYNETDVSYPQFVQDSLKLIYNKFKDCDLTNVFDSAMVTKEVITNAFTVAGQVITTNTIIRENIR